MTAEVAILNRDAVALAADSALTFRGRRGSKIFQSANKIFALSKYKPVGIMIFGDGLFMEVPWETVIKLYRAHLGNRAFVSLTEYAEDFLNYLSGDPRLNAQEVQDEYVRRVVQTTFHRIRSQIDSAVQTLLEVEEELTDPEIKELTKVLVSRHLEQWRAIDLPPRLPESFLEDVRARYYDSIRELRAATFEKTLTPVSSRWLGEIGLHAIAKFPEDRVEAGTSGIVISGFGDDDLFPEIVSYYVDATIIGHLKCAVHKHGRVTAESSAAVLPFAQSEMVYMFMEGIDPSYEQVVSEFLLRTLVEYPEIIIENAVGDNKKRATELKRRFRRLGQVLFRRYAKELRDHRAATYAQPIVHVISMLPKEELASAAESLVHITSMRRRFSLEAETVGGPIDVAVISKGDGFIWIKRKHYFSLELNPHFTTTYFPEECASD